MTNVQNQLRQFENTFARIKQKISDLETFINIFDNEYNNQNMLDGFEFVNTKKNQILEIIKLFDKLKEHRIRDLAFIQPSAHDTPFQENVVEMHELSLLSNKLLQLLDITFNRESFGVDDCDAYARQLQHLTEEVKRLPGNSNGLLTDLCIEFNYLASAFISLGLYFLLYVTLSNGALLAGSMFAVVAILIVGLTACLHLSNQTTEEVGIFHSLIEKLGSFPIEKTLIVDEMIQMHGNVNYSDGSSGSKGKSTPSVMDSYIDVDCYFGDANSYGDLNYYIDSASASRNSSINVNMAEHLDYYLSNILQSVDIFGLGGPVLGLGGPIVYSRENSIETHSSIHSELSADQGVSIILQQTNGRTGLGLFKNSSKNTLPEDKDYVFVEPAAINDDWIDANATPSPLTI